MKQFAFSLFSCIYPNSYKNTIACVLLQAWADAFRSSPDLTGVVHIYEELKRKGIEFPMADLDALSPIHTPQRVGGFQQVTDAVATCFHADVRLHRRVSVSQGTPEVDPAMTKYLAPASPPAVTPKPTPSPAPPTQASQAPGSSITATPDQVRSAAAVDGYQVKTLLLLSCCLSRYICNI